MLTVTIEEDFIITFLCVVIVSICVCFVAVCLVEYTVFTATLLGTITPGGP